MPRKYKLTWQPGAEGRGGRWRKKHKSKSYYFDGGRGKTDREAYDAALAEWERMKVRLDAAAPKRHQADYERVIGKWEQVLTWCRNHNESDMADAAIAKIDVLRRNFAKPQPPAVQQADTFEGQFEWSTRFPSWEQGMAEIVDALNDPSLVKSSEEPSAEPLVIPPRQGWEADPLQQDLLKWNDRLEVAARSAAVPEETVRAHVDAYVTEKEAATSAGDLSSGRAYVIRLHLDHFAHWLGSDTPVVDIAGTTLTDYRLKLLQHSEAEDWSRVTARERLGTVKGFVHWLWELEAIPTLPRIMAGKSKVLQITTPSAPIVVFTMAELQTLLSNASDRTKLYILLMLNCAMTQKDVADLLKTEVDWDAGFISRKRSKTKGWANVPVVRYVLWLETLRLLRQECSSDPSEQVLLNNAGGNLWSEELQPNGKLKKNDNIRNAFARLTKKTNINKPLKSLKKTSASLIRGNVKYTSLESLFLGHAPQSMADKHYAAIPQDLLDEAIVWLGSEYGLK